MKLLDKFSQGLEERYQRLYGGKDCKKKIEKVRKDLLILFGGMMFVLSIAIITGLMDSGSAEGVRINSRGEITAVERPSKNADAISFNAEVEVDTKDGPVTRDLHITIDPVDKKETESEGGYLPEKSELEKVEDELNRQVARLNADTSKKYVTLPEALQGGQSLNWKLADESNLPLYLTGILILSFLLYKNRFYAVAKEERKAAESIVRELPEFINKLVLLLNAGIVLNTAFVKIMEDRRKIGAESSYFYEQLDQVNRSIKETNGSLHEELRSFAKRSGVRELMRITNIISDNISKGADLAEKLRKENELLWFARKEQSKEKGRLAETKLTLPLMILLLVLILVTIAPALMEI